MTIIQRAKLDLFRIVKRYLSIDASFQLADCLDFDKMVHYISKSTKEIYHYVSTTSTSKHAEYLALKCYLSDLEQISEWQKRILDFTQPLCN